MIPLQLNSSIFNALNIKHAVSSAYHPQTNGQVTLKQDICPESTIVVLRLFTKMFRKTFLWPYLYMSLQIPNEMNTRGSKIASAFNYFHTQL